LRYSLGMKTPPTYTIWLSQNNNSVCSDCIFVELNFNMWETVYVGGVFIPKEYLKGPTNLGEKQLF